MLDNNFCEEFFPNIQSKPHLSRGFKVQLHQCPVQEDKHCLVLLPTPTIGDTGQDACITPGYTPDPCSASCQPSPLFHSYLSKWKGNANLHLWPFGTQQPLSFLCVFLLTWLDQIAPCSACYKSNFFMFLTHIVGWTSRLKMPLRSGDIEVPTYPNLACTKLGFRAAGFPSFFHRPFSLTNVLFIAGCASVSEIGPHLVQPSKLWSASCHAHQRQLKLRSQPDWRWKRRCNKYLVRPSGNFWRD